MNRPSGARPPRRESTTGPASAADAGLVRRFVSALRQCATESDIVQVLYSHFGQPFGFESVVLQVLEEEGWAHGVAVDRGVLQDVARRRAEDSLVFPLYANPQPTVLHPSSTSGALERSRGPGARGLPRTVIFLPVRDRGRVIGSVLFQAQARRRVGRRELDTLVEIHEQLGPPVAAAYLSAASRDQAIRLTILNELARAMFATLGVGDVTEALHRTLRQWLPIRRVSLATPSADRPGWATVTAYDGVGAARTTEVSLRARSLFRPILSGGEPIVATEPEAGAAFETWVRVDLAEGRRAALGVEAESSRSGMASIQELLLQVANQVALALLNADTYADSEERRLRLEVVNAVGRRLAASLDRWSVMRTLREELGRHIDFDQFALVTVTTGDDPIAEGYLYDSGMEQRVPPVSLSRTRRALEAYQTRQPVVVRDSPLAREIRSTRPRPDSWVDNPGGLAFVPSQARPDRTVTRSFVWLPVLEGDRVAAMLSVQSYRRDAFTRRHIELMRAICDQVGLALANADHFAEAQAGRERVETILANTPVGMSLEDGRGQVLYANQALLDLYGVTEAEVLGRNLEQVFEHVGADRRASEVEGVTSLEVPGRSGRHRIVDLTRVELRGDEEMSGGLTLHLDVTAQRELSEAKDLILRAVGHELRSPANAIKQTLAASLQWADQPGMVKELLPSAYAAAERLAEMVESMLLVAKLETGGFDPAPVEVDLPSTLDEVLEVLDHRYPQIRTRVVSRIASDAAGLLCEPTHLRQVLTNLVGNALEYTRAPVVVEAVRAPGAGAVSVSVCDSGPGVPEGRVASLFTRTNVPGRNRRRGGLGLGLYLCRLIVERSFAGEISYAPVPGGGSRFQFTVPAAVPAPAAPRPARRSRTTHQAATPA